MRQVGSSATAEALGSAQLYSVVNVHGDKVAVPFTETREMR